MHDIGPTMAAPSSALGPQSNHHGISGAGMATGQHYGGNPYFHAQQLMAQPHQYAAAYADLQPMQMAYNGQAPQMMQGGIMQGHAGMQYPGHFEQQTSSPPQSYEEDQRPLAPVTPPPQRERFSYTRYQLELLNTVYVKVRYPNSMQKQLIAKRVGITRDQVKIWFQNRRRKDVVKPKSHAEPIDNGPSMVPENIKSAIVAELMRHEVDLKGKAKKGGKPYQVTVAQRRAAAKQRASSSPTSLSTAISPAATTSSINTTVINSSARLSSNGSPQSDQNNSRDSHSAMLNMSDNSNQGFNPMTPPSDCSSESGGLRNEGSPKDNVSDQSHDSIHPYHISTESISPCSSVSGDTSKPSITGLVANDNAAYIPTARGLDMPGPPNAVAPGSSLTPYAMQELRHKIKQDSEPPKLDIPPNKVAPPSEAIPIVPQEGIPISQPLTVNIPNSMLSTKTSPISEHSNSYSSPPSAIQGWQQSSRPASDEYTQYSRDNPVIMRTGATTVESLQGQLQSFEPKVLPFPLVADSPMMLSSIPAYNESYQSGLKPGSHGAPGPYGRDPYHPLMISSFQNPYYSQDANGHWSRPYSQPY